MGHKGILSLVKHSNLSSMKHPLVKSSMYISYCHMNVIVDFEKYEYKIVMCGVFLISVIGDKKLTTCRYIQCKCVSVACDCAPIKVDGSHDSNSGIDERAIGKSNLSY